MAPTPKTRLLGTDHEVIVRIDVGRADITLEWLAAGVKHAAMWPDEIHAAWRYNLIRSTWDLRRVILYAWPANVTIAVRSDRFPFRIAPTMLDRFPAWFRRAIHDNAPKGFPTLRGNALM